MRTHGRDRTPHDRLQIGRRGLRQTDVDQNAFGHGLQALAVLGDERVDPLLITRRHRDEELLDDVGQLGDAQALLTQLGDLALELADPREEVGCGTVEQCLTRLPYALAGCHNATTLPVRRSWCTGSVNSSVSRIWAPRRSRTPATSASSTGCHG